jgi:hypothetical protein
MLASPNAAWTARAQNADPVEGSSEIDICFDHEKYLIFIEAKLGSDISLSTSYDPERNQIARNIDCVIEEAGDRVPIFWMVVRDLDASRAYVQLMQSYRSDPAILAAILPHRDSGALEVMARNLVVLQWADFGELVCSRGADETVNAVKLELERRIMTAAVV